MSSALSMGWVVSKVMGHTRDAAPALTARTLKPQRSFVSNRGTDLCVCCGADTGVPTIQHITARRYYVVGIGQFCDRCY